MKWLWTTAGLCLLALCSTGPVTEPTKDKFVTPIPGSLLLKAAQKTGDEKYDIYFSTVEEVKDIDKYHILKISYEATVKESAIDTTDPAVSISNDIFKITFNDKLDEYEGGPVSFELEGFIHDKPMIVDDTKWSSFPQFPVDPEGQFATETDKGNFRILRLSAGAIGDMQVKEDLETKMEVPATDNIKYYLGVNNVSTITPCYQPLVDEIIVCDTAIPLIPEAEIIKSLNVISAVLSYEGPSIKLTSNKVGAIDITNLEVITTYNNQKKIVMTIGKLPDFTYNLVDLNTGNDAITLNIIGLNNTNEMLGYVDHIIQDIDLIGYPVSATSLEVRWDYLKDIDDYKIQRDGDGTSFKEAKVTCKVGVGKQCFGYFADLLKSKYKVTVQGINNSELEVNQIQSSTINVGNSLADLHIQHVQLQGYGHELEITVCFNHTNNNDEAFSHYDVVLIDRTGQFQKDKLIAMKAAGRDHFCSRPFSVKDQAFEVTEEAKIIVIKRAHDGLSVLASGEARLL